MISFSQDFMSFAIYFALFILVISFALVIYRIVKGPTLPDRILALDMLVGIGIGFIAVIAVKTRYAVYLDVAIALGLVGFLATVAFARFILNRSKDDYQTIKKAEDEAILEEGKG